MARAEAIQDRTQALMDPRRGRRWSRSIGAIAAAPDARAPATSG